MSADDTATDTMREYETDQDSGDASSDPQPAVSPAPGHLGNDASDNPDPIPMATPQSPVQTEDSPEVTKDGTPEVRSNKGEKSQAGGGDREYREV